MRQGCIVSSILFLVTDLPSTSILYTLSWNTMDSLSHIEDLDSPDDIAMLFLRLYPPSGEIRRPQYQRKENRSEHQPWKSKIIHVNAATTVQIIIHGEPLDKVGQYTYLGSVYQYRQQCTGGLVKQGAL